MNLTAEWVAAAGTVVGAIFTAVTAGIALKAAESWKSGLQLQRYDECLAAAYELSGMIGRAVSFKVNHNDRVVLALDETWTSWRKFNSTYMVASRYTKPRSEGLSEKASAIVVRLGHFIGSQLQPNDKRGDVLNSDIRQVVTELDRIMRA